MNTKLDNYLNKNPFLIDLLNHKSTLIPSTKLTIPGPNYLDEIFLTTNRNIKTIKNMQSLIQQGRLANTGYLSILPVDQGIEHGAAFSFYKNIDYFDPENIFKLALESSCNALASSPGILALKARKYAHKIPLIMKINHNELLSYPNSYKPSLFSTVKEAWNMGCIGIGITIYFGSPESKNDIEKAAILFEEAHDLGLITILWAYLRNDYFLIKNKENENQDLHLASDLTGQANHISVTLNADLVKQKIPETDQGFINLNFGKAHQDMYSKLTSDHPIDRVRYQVANNYLGQIGLINSGGASGKNDIVDAIAAAIINKRAGGMGLILGRKAFQKPLAEGIEIINLIQDVYLNKNITIA